MLEGKLKSPSKPPNDDEEPEHDHEKHDIPQPTTTLP